MSGEVGTLQGQPQKKLFVIGLMIWCKKKTKPETGNQLSLVFWKMMLTFAPRFKKKPCQLPD
jgi:hypothetical protein